MTILTKFDLAENRRKVVDYLRKNPEGYGQVQVQLRQGNSRCAMGMCGEALSIPLPETDSEAISPEGDKFYHDVEELLGCEAYFIYVMNDLKKMNFSEIADELERRWFGDTQL